MSKHFLTVTFFSTIYNVFSRNRDQEKLLAELINIEKINLRCLCLQKQKSDTNQNQVYILAVIQIEATRHSITNPIQRIRNGNNQVFLLRITPQAVIRLKDIDTDIVKLIDNVVSASSVLTKLLDIIDSGSVWNMKLLLFQ